MALRRRRQRRPFEEFKIKKDENWQIFCGDIQKERPEWGNRQHCFGDCWNAESHVAKENAPAEKEKEFGTWMKKARQSK